MAEWLFGLDDDIKPMEQRLAFQMQRKAVDRESENLLSGWAYRLSSSEEKKEIELAQYLLFEDEEKISWLKSKEFPGKYIIEFLETSCN